ncbi:MAG: enoyl-CoA hydratase-related protein, partial [Sphingobium sp.]
MSEEQAVLVERRGHVMLVTLNRPDARNAINHAIWVGAGSALAEAEADVDVRAVIITGAGDKSFCAGADLKALSRGEMIAPEDPVQLGWGFAGIVSHAISKPVIAAVNGTAL